MPPGDPTHIYMGWITVPSAWAMEVPKLAVKRKAMRDFSTRLIDLSPWRKTYPPRMLVDCVKRCQECAGVLVLRDPSQAIPGSSANVLDFFFGRDKAEALVYEWQPWEKIFRLVDRDWLLLRRA